MNVALLVGPHTFWDNRVKRPWLEGWEDLYPRAGVCGLHSNALCFSFEDPAWLSS